MEYKCNLLPFMFMRSLYQIIIMSMFMNTNMFGVLCMLPRLLRREAIKSSLMLYIYMLTC